MRRSRIAFMAIGALSLTAAAFGLQYNVSTLRTVPRWSGLLGAPHMPPHFLPVFYAMSAIGVICNAVLIVCGIQYVRMRSNLNRLFAGLMAFEVLYFAFVSLAGNNIPGIGTSVGICAGLANGGLTPQVIVLLPLWAPFVAMWAGKRLREPPATRT